MKQGLLFRWQSNNIEGAWVPVTIKPLYQYQMAFPDFNLRKKLLTSIVFKPVLQQLTLHPE